MVNETIVKNKEAQKMIEKYRAMTPAKRQVYGDKILTEISELSEKLNKLNGKSGTFVDMKKNMYQKRISSLRIAVDGCAEIKYDHLKNGGSIEEYTSVFDQREM